MESPNGRQSRKADFKSNEADDDESQSASSSGVPSTDALEFSDSNGNGGSYKYSVGVKSPRTSSPTNQLNKKTNGAGSQHDMRFWKKILMQWIIECKFIEQNYFHLEQANIDDFYEQFRKCLYHLADVDSKHKILDFLKENYPDFEPHLDDENELSSADYVYVFSLLLHYCCIKSPHEYFHNICKKLSNQTQNVIADFFKVLMDQNKFRREDIRRAIATLGDANSNKSSSSDSSTLSSSGISSPSFSCLESPVRTPKRHPLNKVSPSTPKTFRLEEQTRELINLRAQIETERYEKGLLEVQIKQYEESISKIHAEHRKLSHELQEIKSQLLTRYSETDTKKVDDDQVKRRLIKEISDKEAEISSLTEELKLLEDEKCMLQQKLKFAQSQIVICMDRVNDLDSRVESLNQKLKEKDHQIVLLNDNKLELEQYIAEMRSSMPKEGPDFNSSVDCLDGNFSRNGSSTDSMSSPENLGVSVIDVQFKAIQKENHQLKNEVEQLREYNKEFAQTIHRVLTSYCDDMKASMENEGNHLSESLQYIMNKVYNKKMEELEEASDEFEIFCVFFNKLNEAFLTEKLYAKHLKEQHIKLTKTNEDLNEKFCKVQAEIDDLKQKAVAIAVANETIEIEKGALASQLNDSEQAILLMKSQNDDLSLQVEQLQKALKEQGEKFDLDLKEQKMQNKMLKESNLQVCEINSKMESDLSSLKERYETSLKSYEEAVSNLTSALNNVQADLMLSKSNEMEAEKQVLEHSAKIDKLEKAAEEAKEHLKTMNENLKEKQKLAGEMGEQIIQMKQKNESLEEGVKNLQAKYKDSKQFYEMQIKKLVDDHDYIKSSFSSTKERLASVEEDYQNARDELRKIKSNVAEVFNAIHMPLPSENFVDNSEELLQHVVTLFEGSSNLREKVKELEFVTNEQAREVTNLKAENIAYEGKLDLAMSKNLKLQKEQKDVLKNMEEQQKRLSELEQNHIDSNQFNERLLKQHQKDYEKLLKEKQLEYEKGTSDLEAAVQELENVIRFTIEERDQKVIQLSNDKMQIEELLNKQIEEMKEQIINLDKSLALNESKLKCHEEKSQMMEERLQEKDNDINRFKDLLTDTEKLKISLAEELKTSKQEYQNYREQMDSKLKEMEKLSSVLKDTEDQCSSLRKELDNRNSQIKNLKEDLDVLSKDLDVMKLKLKEAQDEKQVMAQTFHEIKLRLEENEKEQTQKTFKLEKQLAETLHSNQEICELNTKLQAELANLNLELQSLRESYDSMKSDLSGKLEQVSLKLQESTHSLDLSKKTLEKITFTVSQVLSQKLPDIVKDNDSEESHQLEQYFKHMLSSEFDCSFNDLIDSLNRFLNLFMKIEKEILSNKDQLRLHENNNMYLSRLKQQLEDSLKAKTKENLELQEQLSNDLQAHESKLFNEIKSLYKDRENLEQVNKKLSDENHSLSLKLTQFEENVFKLTEKLNSVKTEKDSLDEQFQSLSAKAKKDDLKWQDILKQAESNRSQMESSLNKLKADIFQSDQEKLKLQSELNHLGISFAQAKQKLQDKEAELQRERNRLQDTIEQMDQACAEKAKQISSLISAKNDLEIALKESRKDYNQICHKLDQVSNEKISLENHLHDSKSSHQQTSRTLEVLKVQLETALNENDRLNSDLDELKQEKSFLFSDLKEKEKEISRANDNVTKMIGELACIRREKEALENEKQLLSQQIKEINKTCIHSETKLKEKLENVQAMERNLLSQKNEINLLQDQIKKLSSAEEKLTKENSKLRETTDNQIKRIEKLALQLGDFQARNSKLDRDLEKLKSAHENCLASLESLQKEKSNLQLDIKSFKEKLNRSERTIEQLSNKVPALEKANATLRETNKKLEDSEIDNITKIKKLEKLRQSQEEKIRNLSHSLENSDSNTNRLNLEVGALNSEINELKLSAKDLQQKLDHLLKENSDYKDSLENQQDLNQKLHLEITKLNEELVDLTDKNDKLILNLKISDEKFATLSQDLDLIRKDLLVVRADKGEEQRKYQQLFGEFNDYKNSAEHFKKETLKEVKSLNSQILDLKQQLVLKNEELHSFALKLEESKKLSQIRVTSEKLEELQTRLNIANSDLAEEKKMTAQLRNENEALLAKNREDCSRIRSEYDVKLEKMKAKMRNMYRAQSSKWQKNEDDLSQMKTEKVEMERQLEAFEQHIKKLSNDVLQLNEEIVRLKTENAMLMTKNKHLEDERSMSINNHKHQTLPRTSVSQKNLVKKSHTHASSSLAMPAPAAPRPSTNIVSNLAMEDEEGEVFNNTYLTDLKNGRMSELCSRDICEEELRHRNSLWPPHMRSSYAAQYIDTNLGNDDLKVRKPTNSLRMQPYNTNKRCAVQNKGQSPTKDKENLKQKQDNISK